MTNVNDYKWLISSSLKSQSSSEEKANWDETTKNIQQCFSMTIDPEFCKKLILGKSESGCCDIPNSPEVKVIIPGCGFNIYLQKTLLEFCPNIGQVYCTDFSAVAVEEAKRRWRELDGDARLNNQQLIFEEADSTKLTEEHPDWQEKFDYVLVVSSVISGDDVRNRQILREFYKILKPGGKLYATFPSIFLDFEAAYLNKSFAHFLTDGSINLPTCTRYFQEENYSEIYYTPLRLNRILKEAGFKRQSFELFFADSDIFINQVKEGEHKKSIDFEDPDIHYWEFLVRLEKEKI